MVKKSSILLSICIPTHNRAGLLERMLLTLGDALDRVPSLAYEVVFRDNASTDSTSEVIARFRKNHPVRYFRNVENIGVTRNILMCPEGALGEFVWMLGDDDLILPDAISRIVLQLQKYPDLDGHVACHAVEEDSRRDDWEHKLAMREKLQFSRQLIRASTNVDQLDRLERVFKLSELSAPLNFFSNLVYRRSSWQSRVGAYQQHCAEREWFSDTITSAGYLCVWAEIMAGRPVGLIASPLLIGFIGRQAIVDKWATLCMVYFLDASNWFINNGACLECVRVYQRKIYTNVKALTNLIASRDPYTLEHFSLKRLIAEYGDDRELWKSLENAIRSAQGLRLKAIVACKITRAMFSLPRFWARGAVFTPRVMAVGGLRAVRLLVAKFLDPYGSIRNFLDLLATLHFKHRVKAQGQARIHHPIILLNPDRIKTGAQFAAGPGLRLECWNRYRGQEYAPQIVIGERVSLGHNCHLGAISAIHIGNDVLMGSNILIIDHNHGNPRKLFPGRTFREQPLVSKGPVKIGNNVWIGENVCILPGVCIGDNAVIGAGSIVISNVERNSISCGAPAELIKKIGFCSY